MEILCYFFTERIICARYCYTYKPPNPDATQGTAIFLNKQSHTALNDIDTRIYSGEIVGKLTVHLIT